MIRQQWLVCHSRAATSLRRDSIEDVFGTWRTALYGRDEQPVPGVRLVTREKIASRGFAALGTRHLLGSLWQGVYEGRSEKLTEPSRWDT